MTGPLAARLSHLALWTPVTVYALLVARGFFRHADTAVRLSTDDGLANVSYALATEGQYGFLSSPVLLGLARDQGLFSYGPFYFYVGAALIWLFGYSLTIMRAVHLAIILAIALAGRAWFGRAAAGAVAAIVAVGLLVAFERGQWPMVRPDSMVSFFAVALVICAGLAIRTGRNGHWAGAGFAAACGALTHLVAWSLVPAVVVILLIGVVASWRTAEGAWARPTIPWAPTLATAGGGLVGVLLFYASFGFRIRDQIQFLAGYQEYTGSMTALAESGPRFSSLVLEHFARAYWYLPYPLEYAVWATLFVALTATVLLVAVPVPRHREHLAMVAPPVVVWIAYLISLGTYNNFHSGYTILNQVMWLWTLGALGATTLTATEPWPRVRQALAVAAYSLAFVLGVGVLTFLAQRTEYRALAAGGAVSINEYTSRVLEPIPAGARSWGSVAFGIEHPGRIQLVQFDDAVAVMDAIPPDKREDLAPDYLVWGYSENSASARQVLSNGSGPAFTLARLFPKVDYTLVALTTGAPYGVTRVYARRDGAPEMITPTLAFHDGLHGRWNRALAPSVTLDVNPASAVRLMTGADGNGAAHVSVQTVSAELPADTYLLRVGLTPDLPSGHSGVWMASSTTAVRDSFGEYGPDLDMAPRVAGEAAVYLVYAHPGGSMYVSQFGAGAAAIQSLEASRLLSLPDYSAFRRAEPEEHPIPAGQWVHPNTLVGPDWPDQPEIRLSSHGDAFVLVEGNAIQFGYQAYGPQIPVEPFQRIRLRFSVEVLAGTACFGVLDGTGMAWLVVPERLLPEYEFQVNDSRTVKPVLANCSSSREGIVPIRAIIGPGSYALWPERETRYVELLMRLFRDAGPQSLPQSLVQ